MSKTATFIMLAAIMTLAGGIYLSAQEPCSGESIEVLNDDPCDASMWIGVRDSATICQILCLLKEDPEKCGIDPSWIGGTVQVDENAKYGFTFDAGTVRIAEMTAETYQTTICQISNDPKYYDGGTWYIQANFKETRPY